MDRDLVHIFTRIVGVNKGLENVAEEVVELGLITYQAVTKAALEEAPVVGGENMIEGESSDAVVMDEGLGGVGRKGSTLERRGVEWGERLRRHLLGMM